MTQTFKTMRERLGKGCGNMITNDYDSDLCGEIRLKLKLCSNCQGRIQALADAEKIVKDAIDEWNWDNQEGHSILGMKKIEELKHQLGLSA